MKLSQSATFEQPAVSALQTNTLITNEKHYILLPKSMRENWLEIGLPRGGCSPHSNIGLLMRLSLTRTGLGLGPAWNTVRPAQVSQQGQPESRESIQKTRSTCLPLLGLFLPHPWNSPARPWHREPFTEPPWSDLGKRGNRYFLKAF